MFSYPAAALQPKFDPAGSVTAYLVDGHVAFFTSRPVGPDGTFSPYAASAQPAVDGMAGPYPWATTCKPFCHATLVEAFGYAHGNVAYVDVRLPDGRVVTTPTFAAWPGSGLRLWRVSLRASSWHMSEPLSTYTATAYDAAGHVVGHVQLGQPEIGAA